MSFLDAVWHLLNFLAPAGGMALIAATASKLLWRDELSGVSWRRLVASAATGCCVALVAGLLWFGRDGRIATYVAMVLACAGGLWIAGFVRRGR